LFTLDPYELNGYEPNRASRKSSIAGCRARLATVVLRGVPVIFASTASMMRMPLAVT
jgi:hypothetical protein